LTGRFIEALGAMPFSIYCVNIDKGSSISYRLLSFTLLVLKISIYPTNVRTGNETFSSNIHCKRTLSALETLLTSAGWAGDTISYISTHQVALFSVIS